MYPFFTVALLTIFAIVWNSHWLNTSNHDNDSIICIKKRRSVLFFCAFLQIRNNSKIHQNYDCTVLLLCIVASHCMDWLVGCRVWLTSCIFCSRGYFAWCAAPRTRRFDYSKKCIGLQNQSPSTRHSQSQKDSPYIIEIKSGMQEDWT